MYNLVQIFYMRTIDEWLTLYGRDHQNPTNKLIHWICVPVILFTVFGLLMSIPFPLVLIGLKLWQFSLIVFIIAWIFQFIGHKIEGQKPSFIEDLQFLLIGPIWLLHFILKKIGLPYK